jgi:hypothetical protein
MKFSTSRAATLRIEGELDAVGTSELGPPGKALVAERQSRIVAELSGSRLVRSLDLGVGAVVFLYKKGKPGVGGTTVHSLCDQPLAIVNVLCMEEEAAGVRQSRHLAHGYLHMAAKTPKSQIVPVAGRLLNAQVLPFSR